MSTPSVRARLWRFGPDISSFCSQHASQWLANAHAAWRRAPHPPAQTTSGTWSRHWHRVPMPQRPGPAASMVFVVRCLFWVLLGVGGSVCELWMLLAGRERDARGRARGGLMTDAYYFSSSSLLPRRRSPLARSSSLLLFSSGGLAGAAWLVGGLGAKRAPLVLGDFAKLFNCRELLE